MGFSVVRSKSTGTDEEHLVVGVKAIVNWLLEIFKANSIEKRQFLTFLADCWVIDCMEGQSFPAIQTLLASGSISRVSSSGRECTARSCAFRAFTLVNS